MYCKKCGKVIDDNAVVCPYCGCATGKVAEKKINSFGIAGFVVSLVSIWVSYYCIVPFIGLILSAIGLRNREECKVNGLAIAGLVISIITLVYGMIVLIATFK